MECSHAIREPEAAIDEVGPEGFLLLYGDLAELEEVKEVLEEALVSPIADIEEVHAAAGISRPILVPRSFLVPYSAHLASRSVMSGEGSNAWVRPLETRKLARKSLARIIHEDREEMQFAA